MTVKTFTCWVFIAALCGCGKAAPQGTTPPRLVADFSGASVTLRGSLPDQRSHDRVLERARQLYGQAQVNDRIEVSDKVIDARWVGTDLLLLPLVDSGIRDGQAIFDGKSLQLTGQVHTQSILAQLSKRAMQAADGAVPVENHLQVLN